MLKGFCISLALHLGALGGLAWLTFSGLCDLAVIGLPPGATDAPGEFVFIDDEPPAEEFAAIEVPPPDPSLDAAKAATQLPAPRAETQHQRSEQLAGLRRPEPLVRPLPRPRWLAPGELDTVATLRDASAWADGDPVELARHYLPQFEKIPEGNVQEITAKLRTDYGVENHNYEPLHEATTARPVDFDHSVVYYRMATKAGKRMFQELLLDRDGYYMVSKEKPESEMDLTDKMRIEIFTNPAMSSVRNLALGLVEKEASQQESRPPVPK